MLDARRVGEPLDKGHRRSTEKLPALQVYESLEQAFSFNFMVHPLAKELLGLIL